MSSAIEKWLTEESGYLDDLGPPLFEKRDENNEPILVSVPLNKPAYTKFLPCQSHKVSPCTECMIEFNIPPCPDHGNSFCPECIQKYEKYHDPFLWSLNNVCRFGHKTESGCLEMVPDPAQNLDKATRLMLEFKYEQQNYKPYEGSDINSNEYLMTLIILRNEANSMRQAGRIVDTTKRVISENFISYSGPSVYLDHWEEERMEPSDFPVSEPKHQILEESNGEMDLYEDKMEF